MTASIIAYCLDFILNVDGKQAVRECKFQKTRYDTKGLMTQEFAKIPILGQPVNV
jgi:hypothetical protein